MDLCAIKKQIQQMDIDTLLGQLLCYSVTPKWSEEEFAQIVRRTKPGGLFFNGTNGEFIRRYTRIANENLEIPVIVAADVENGPGCALEGEELLPFPMAWGAADDAELTEQAGEATAAIAQKNGIHWTFAPIVDLNRNPDNPVTNIRAISDSPEQVIRIGGAYMRGLQKENRMVACCKHFPGDGVDDRNQHFCTTINSLSKEQWMATFGKVYQEMIRQGVGSIMVGHIALPAYDGEKVDEILGYRPAIISKPLITDLLKGELGFQGCVVSDALSMIGSCSVLSEDKLVAEFIRAGGDMALFALPVDFDRLKTAYEQGMLSPERIRDAVLRVLQMKAQAGVLDGNTAKAPDPGLDIKTIGQKIAEKSIKIVRNAKGVLPVKLETGDKVLVINIQRVEETRVISPFVRYMDTFEEELRSRGLTVEVLVNPLHNEVKKKMQDAKTVFVNCKIGVHDYLGGSLRIAWPNIMLFWRGFLFNHPSVVFTSFGDPYKLHDFPYLYTYVNAFSSAEASQRAAVQVLLGEKPCVAKNPVSHEGYFEREVE